MQMIKDINAQQLMRQQMQGGPNPSEPAQVRTPANLSINS